MLGGWEHVPVGNRTEKRVLKDTQEKSDLRELWHTLNQVRGEDYIGYVTISKPVIK